MRKSILLLFAIFFLFACSFNQSKIDDNYSAITLVPKRQGTAKNFSYYFTLSKIVKLETSKLSLIGEIDKICFSPNRICILDGKSNSILIYDSNGKFIFKLKKEGKGPYEYIRACDLQIAGDTLIVLDGNTHKLIYYDESGKNLDEKQLSYPGFEFLQLDQNRKVYFCHNSSNSKLVDKTSGLYYNLFLESNNDIIIKECPFPKELQGHYYTMRYFNAISASNKEKYVVDPLNSTIFSISGNTIFPKYKIDFGSKELTEDVKKSPDRLRKELDNYCHSIRNIYEDSALLFFEYNDKYFYRAAVFEKPNYTYNECIPIFDKKNGIPLDLMNTKSENNFIVSILEPTRIKEIFKEKDDTAAINSKIMNELNNSLEPTDNPVLLLYKRIAKKD